MELTEQNVAEAIRVALSPRSIPNDLANDAKRLIAMLRRRESIEQELAKIQLRVTKAVNGEDCKNLAAKLTEKAIA